MSRELSSSSSLTGRGKGLSLRVRDDRDEIGLELRSDWKGSGEDASAERAVTGLEDGDEIESRLTE